MTEDDTFHKLSDRVMEISDQDIRNFNYDLWDQMVDTLARMDYEKHGNMDDCYYPIYDIKITVTRRRRQTTA